MDYCKPRLPLWSLSLVLAALSLQACHTVQISNPQGSSKSYLGYVKLEIDRSDKERFEYVHDSTVIGASFNDGIAIGYMHNRLLSVPLDCKIVFIVADSDQYEHATRLLQSIDKGLNGCVISQEKP